MINYYLVFTLYCPLIIGVVTNVTVDIDPDSQLVEIRWEDPASTNGIITGYNLIFPDQTNLNQFIIGGSARYVSFSSLGKYTIHSV